MEKFISRREFIKKSTAAGVALGLTGTPLYSQSSDTRSALVVYGGWKGHEPSI
ncbi:MAG: twin-arginine translocation signal domain-containing protein, partial [Candidatus Marinimicrobia bacterium]|nr:twin-arginine translocation signal domain-containing protein [Candidatus Neomarinimicrobiota bacterium]